MKMESMIKQTLLKIKKHLNFTNKNRYKIKIADINDSGFVFDCMQKMFNEGYLGEPTSEFGVFSHKNIASIIVDKKRLDKDGDGNKTSGICILKQQGRNIAFLSFTLHDSSNCELWLLYVVKESRNHGAGRYLIKQSLEILQPVNAPQDMPNLNAVVNIQSSPLLYILIKDEGFDILAKSIKHYFLFKIAKKDTNILVTIAALRHLGWNVLSEKEKMLIMESMKPKNVF